MNGSGVKFFPTGYIVLPMIAAWLWLVWNIYRCGKAARSSR